MSVLVDDIVILPSSASSDTLVPALISNDFADDPLNVYWSTPSVVPDFTFTVNALLVLLATSDVPAVEGFPIFTFWAVPLDGVTVKDPSDPLAKVYVVLDGDPGIVPVVTPTIWPLSSLVIPVTTAPPQVTALPTVGV